LHYLINLIEIKNYKFYNIVSMINLLANIPVFQGLRNDYLNKIKPLLKPRTFPPETLIIKQGTTGDSVFIIKNGSVKISRINEQGEEIFLQNLYNGSYFGDFSLIDKMPRSANVTTIEKSEILQLDKIDLDTLLSENIHIANIFFRNCLNETFSRFRNIISNFSFSQHSLKEKSAILEDINRDLSLARQLQEYFINTDDLENEQNLFEGIRHSYIYQPSHTIGGDFLNVVKLNKNLLSVIIADVEGHGITAALATGVLKSSFSIKLKELGRKPAKLMTFLNQQFCQVISQLFATCYHAIINTRNKSITMSRAGHHHPLFWKEKKKDFIQIECAGAGLGIITEAKFEEVKFKIEEGDKILFYTDGIIEQINDNKEMYSLIRLQKTVSHLIQNGETEILKVLFQDLKIFADNLPLEDDITLVLFEF